MTWNPTGETKRYASDCGDAMGYYQRYPIPVAAALWCGVPPDAIAGVLSDATNVGRAVVGNPYVRCLEPKCRALHEAIESGELRVYRETGGAVSEHVAPERRHVARTELRDWITKHYPDQRPPTLFDATERATHSAIKTADFEALQADRDAARAALKKAAELNKENLEKISELHGERTSLAAMVEKMNAPGARAETTYLNIIGALVELIQTEKPGRDSDATVIKELLDNYSDKPGIKERTLQEKFAAAKRSLLST